MIKFIDNILKDRDKRKRIDFYMACIRTMAAITAATFLIIAHWK